MNGRIDWSQLFLSSSGRAARGPSLIAAAVLILALAVYESVGPLRLFTGFIVYPALVFTGACVLSKRLHDRGRSGWWSLVILFAIIQIWPVPQTIWHGFGVLVIIWAFVELALLPGEQGSNRFGPNPLRTEARPSYSSLDA